MRKARTLWVLGVLLAFGGLAPVLYCITLAAWHLREMEPAQFYLGAAGLLVSALGLLVAAVQVPAVRSEKQSEADRQRRIRVGQYGSDGRVEPFIGSEVELDRRAVVRQVVAVKLAEGR
jgi:hypothetical protein